MTEAIGLLQEHGDDAQIVAGGAMLLILMQQGLVSPGVLVSVNDIDELGGCENRDGALVIGATATLRQIEQSSLVADRFTILREALLQVANVRVRNVATLGGHLAHSDPHLDLHLSLWRSAPRCSFAGRAVLVSCRWKTSSPGTMRMHSSPVR